MVQMTGNTGEMEKTRCNYCHSGNTMMDVHNITIIYSFSVDGV